MNSTFATLVSLLPPSLASAAFRPFREGVEILSLHESADGARAAVLRYAPGAAVPPHRHEGYEYIYVISGEQADERGRYGVGSFVVNEPGSSHAVRSELGCEVLIIWQRPVSFL